MEEEKEYIITTIEEFVNIITPDNFANLMIDFTDVMIKMTEFKKNYKKLHGEYPTTSIMKSYTWIDDSIRGVKIIKFDDGTILEYNNFEEDNESKIDEK